MRLLYQNFLKRVFDLIVSTVAFILLLPVFLVIALLLFIVNRGNPIFVQPRPGKHGKVFRVIKFKTMNDRTDAQGNLLSDEKRLTTVGKFLRKTSLDEIPQLLNVIKGDMSLVGPRPLVVAYLPLYNREQRRRHDVKPGITGWTQVKGRNSLSWSEKFSYDVWYVDNISFLLDLKILFLTVYKVVKSEGISAEGTATMQPFTGNS
ncbi:sugar transferase [Pontibacter pamirensis]|uniref:sugar transferase n=1 Tax=Pontibacter pamirensis TaxID=2562824 RepID=UPI00293B8F46|nr:sugar transferase [Pontibacter pamirensis]